MSLPGKCVFFSCSSEKKRKKFSITTFSIFFSTETWVSLLLQKVKFGKTHWDNTKKTTVRTTCLRHYFATLTAAIDPRWRRSSRSSSSLRRLQSASSLHIRFIFFFFGTALSTVDSTVFMALSVKVKVKACRIRFYSREATLGGGTLVWSRCEAISTGEKKRGE